jgi:hypothetical protein
VFGYRCGWGARTNAILPLHVLCLVMGVNYCTLLHKIEGSCAGIWGVKIPYVSL